MSAIGWVRNAMIFGGIAVGGFVAVRAAMEAPPPVDAGAAGDVVPVLLNTARPVDTPLMRLAKPISLESAFGRTELTGMPTFRVSPDPLHDLGINRDYDGNIELRPERIAPDLPEKKASDEVTAKELDEPLPPRPVAAGTNLDDLPRDARGFADQGKTALDQATTLLVDGLDMVRGAGDARRRELGNQKLAEAARLFETARDHLREALLRAPNHPGVLDLLQEAKAGLFAARKHGNIR